MTREEAAIQMVTIHQFWKRPGWALARVPYPTFSPRSSFSFGGAKGPTTCLGPHLCRGQLSGSFDSHPRLRINPLVQSFECLLRHIRPLSAPQQTSVTPPDLRHLYPVPKFESTFAVAGLLLRRVSGIWPHDRICCDRSLRCAVRLARGLLRARKVDRQ